MLLDRLGIEIKIGDVVLRHVGGKSGSFNIEVVEKLNDSTVKLVNRGNCSPENMVVINDIIKKLSEEHIDKLLDSYSNVMIVAGLDNPNEHMLIKAAKKFGKYRSEKFLNVIKDESLRTLVKLAAGL